MAVKPSGSLSLITDIVGEFGGSTPHSLKEYYRNGTAGVTSNNTNVPESPNPLNMLSFYNAVKQFQHTITSNQQQINLQTYLTGVGWNGSDPVALTINNGVYIWSDNTGSAALIIPSVFNGILAITNNGYIMGKGGNGGNSYSNGSAGGPAIYNYASGVTFNNTSAGYVGGGGGGGAGGTGSGYGTGGGGGAGGGNGGAGSGFSGGAGGGLGGSGANGIGDDNNKWNTAGYGGTAGGGGASTSESGSGYDDVGSGGGGGRVFPGVGGSASYANGSNSYNGVGGAGGSAGGAGGNGLTSNDGGGGGGWGASGGGNGYTSGGAGGAAVAGTSMTYTGTTSQMYGSK